MGQGGAAQSRVCDPVSCRDVAAALGAVGPKDPLHPVFTEDIIRRYASAYRVRGSKERRRMQPLMAASLCRWLWLT